MSEPSEPALEHWGKSIETTKDIAWNPVTPTTAEDTPVTVVVKDIKTALVFVMQRPDFTIVKQDCPDD